MTPSMTTMSFSFPQRFTALAMLCLAGMLSGCVTFDMKSLEKAADVMSWGSPDLVTAKKQSRSTLTSRLQIFSHNGPKASARTVQVLRQNALVTNYSKDYEQTLKELQGSINQEPTADKMLAFAELAFLAAKTSEAKFDEAKAVDMYGASVAHAYGYLFDPRFDQVRNPYDPQFRQVCQLYNESLEGALRIVDRQGKLKPGHRHLIKSCGQEIELEIKIKGNWDADDFARFEFVSDYQMQGLNNEHRTWGLGVPLIAIRKSHEEESPAEKYYPSGLAFPVTAFLRVSSDEVRQVAHVEGQVQRCVLELCDPLDETDVTVCGRQAPLQSNISTPLAYYLNNPLLKNNTFATWALLNADFAKEFSGVYMMEPYSPDKIPVVLVHGLWSSPVTWMQMYNDLRAMPELREKYQFWFYLYPSGQPFWISSQQMRTDLADLRQNVDPQRESATLDQMVLIGHSMGGLVSTMQTISSKEDFWHIISDHPFAELKASEEARKELSELLFFEPNESIRRVVTIGTPHRGSDFANTYTSWISRQVIELPGMLTRGGNQIVKDNPGFFRNTELLTVNTSIDSLSPKSPIFPVMLKAEHSPRVKYNNIIGRANTETSILGGVGSKIAGEGDGVVSLVSARLDDVEKEVIVPADHTTVHQHPRSILEVRRILLDHLDDMQAERPAAAWARQQPTGVPPGSPYRPASPASTHLPPSQNQPASFQPLILR
ncbi:esterase/lipase family protein [Lignipirellula cremea]|uniref:Alpha/beta hydrolase family protein n=1 Tax=Lignipirellula cremea TaxID=2528010 RepID=A0A518E3U2_9BACT|nr:alpha/beta fold hydrolase [Lignipirellula cremea]QDU98713.1 Alpha/beta hydrolase family protein [Lignipirellula cremea]